MTSRGKGKLTKADKYSTQKHKTCALYSTSNVFHSILLIIINTEKCWCFHFLSNCFKGKLRFVFVKNTQHPLDTIVKNKVYIKTDISCDRSSTTKPFLLTSTTQSKLFSQDPHLISCLHITAIDRNKKIPHILKIILNIAKNNLKKFPSLKAVEFGIGKL